ncbi:MAG: pyrroline-5-carboxylate reductase [Gammaproteobacteria bacterium]
MNTQKIGFIGGGNMAASLIKGLIASGHEAQNIWVADIDATKLQYLADQLQVNTSSDNLTVAQAADVLVLAVKPQILQNVAENLAACVQRKKPLVVSIAAGINQQSLLVWLGEQTAIVRCMPNTPALVLTGATALHANAYVTAEQQDLAENILRAVGVTVWVESEAELDAVTAISGSGPAYFFLLMEAMEKTALQLGLSEAVARLLVQQTALGAAKIALESSQSPQQLRRQVTSPGGTTQRALDVFAEAGFEDIVAKAVMAARNRAVDMSRELGGQ